MNNDSVQAIIDGLSVDDVTRVVAQVESVQKSDRNTPAGEINRTQPATDVMARGDYAQWQQRLHATNLSGIQGRVAVVNPFGPATLNQSQVTIQVNWNANSNTGAVVLGRNVMLTAVVAPE